MPLKKVKNTQIKTVKVDEGNPIRTPDGSLMSLYEKAKLPMVTLNVEQFGFPETFLVRSFKRVQDAEINPDTGWDKKVDGKKVYKSTYSIALTLSDGDVAQTLAEQGQSLVGLSTVKCIIEKDIPLQTFAEDETLLKLIHPVVMLTFNSDGQDVTKIVIHAEDAKEV